VLRRTVGAMRLRVKVESKPVAKVEPIRCLECAAAGVRARTVGRVLLHDDETLTVFAILRRRGGHTRRDRIRLLPQVPRVMWQDDGTIRRQVMAGETVKVRCGRRHAGAPGVVVLKTGSPPVLDALRRLGYPSTI
jgi:hypothetical protein